MNQELKNKVVIITGAASGIGRAAANVFSDNGANVVLVDVNENKGIEVLDELQKKGGQSIFVRTDVSSSVDTKRCVEEAIGQFGRLDCLFNNAGINPLGNALDTSEELWDQVININLKGMFLMAKFSIPEMKKVGGGAIVCTGSVDGLQAIPNEVAYIASKGGVIALVRALAVDFAKDNIRVNCVVPGAVYTGLNEKWFHDHPEFEARVAKEHALNRIGRPEEVARVAMFLLSESSSFVTGATIPVDGGYMAAKTGME